MKKTLSILLVLLLIAALGVPAFATGAENSGPKPTVTKNPTSETVDEGGTATFISYADNYNEVVWRIVSNDATNTVQAADAKDYFGCEVYGLGTTSLTITNIPAEMDGWRVEAMFRGPGGVEFSTGALIRVNGVTVKSPTISAEPQPLSLASGETGTLTVSAATLEGTLKFQWYSNTANSNLGGTAIEGATEATYTPEELTGTTYYYVAVSCELNGRTSAPTMSNAVAVTYAAPVDPNAPDPAESAAPASAAPLVPVVDNPGDDPEPTPAGGQNNSSRSAATAQERAGNALNMLTIVGGVLAVAAIIGGITALVVRSRSDDDDDDEDDEA